MKVTVDEHKKASADEYPKLMISSHGTIVLFKREQVGTVVGGRSNTEHGDHSKSWGMSIFTDFHGTITLEND